MKKEKYLMVAFIAMLSMVMTAYGDDFSQVRTTSGGVAVHINSNMPAQVGLTIGTSTKTGTQEPGGGGCIKWFTDDAPVPPQVEGYLQGNACLLPDPNPIMRRLKIEAIEQGTAFRDVTINEQGGNVAVGTNHAAVRFHIKTDENMNGYLEALRIDGGVLSDGWERGMAFVGNGNLEVGRVSAFLQGLSREVRIYVDNGSDTPTLVFRIRGDGATVIGNPSGGFMGPGTLNVGGQIYRNGVPLQ